MENTSNYQLNKPAQNEKVNVELINDNMEIIDQALQENSTNLNTHTADVTIHVTQSNKDNWNDANDKKHMHENKSIIDNVTSTMIESWDNAASHISDAIKHITSNERSEWNEAKLHADSEHARTDAVKTEKSEINGNIKINDEEITVYTHPTGTNPHGTTKNDVGLENVDNTSDVDKPVSSAQQNAINEAFMQSKGYIDTQIADLINGAPENLDTLKEISDAIAENGTIMDALNNSIGTKASKAELDGHASNNVIHVTQTDKENWNESNDKKHFHNNKTILDNITSDIVMGWNNAVSHISDTIKHINSNERSSWDTAKIHADSVHARIDATKVEPSEINGNIKINGTEVKVYTNDFVPELTKNDIGLGNVPNVTTNDQTPTYTESENLTELISGEKLTIAFGKISKAISDLKSHIFDHMNPHKVTKEQLGLNNVENKSSEAIRNELTKSNVTVALGYTPMTTGEIDLSISDAIERHNFILINQQELLFIDNICAINDERITSYSIADVYFTSDTVSIAEKSIITVETYDGKVELVAINAPEGTIKATIRVEVIK